MFISFGAISDVWKVGTLYESCKIINDADYIFEKLDKNKKNHSVSCLSILITMMVEGEKICHSLKGTLKNLEPSYVKCRDIETVENTYYKQELFSKS